MRALANQARTIRLRVHVELLLGGRALKTSEQVHELEDASGRWLCRTTQAFIETSAAHCVGVSARRATHLESSETSPISRASRIRQIARGGPCGCWRRSREFIS